MIHRTDRHIGPDSRLSRRTMLLIAASAVALSACDRKQPIPADDPASPAAPPGPPEGSLEWAIKGSWRSPIDRARNDGRHPMETLRFFGLQPDMTVVDFWPGSGWYTEILAPYLAHGGGRYVAAGFVTGPGSDPAQAALMANYQRRFGGQKLYGDIRFSAFGPMSGPVTDPGTSNLVLFMRTVHSWMAAGIVEKAFADAYSSLRPGGFLGIEQHRLSPEADQDPVAANGYVQEAFVRQLAAEAGFVFVAASDINANPEDTRDHPFGVETLPPQRLSAPQGAPPDPDFDHSKYDAIGESDRMTLKFRKPE